MGKRKRRAFTKEFKAEAVRLVRDSGKSVGAVARELDLTETALRELGAPGRDRRRPWGPGRAHDRGAGGTRAAAAREPDAADGARHPKKSDGLLREGESVRFAFIATEKAAFPVRVLCRTLQVSRAGFYAWQGRPPAPAGAERRPLGRGDRGDPRGEPAAVWQSTDSCRAGGAWLPHQPEAGGAADAPPRLGGAAPPAVPDDDPFAASRSRSRPMSWRGSSTGPPRTRRGSPTSPTFRRARAGSTWR